MTNTPLYQSDLQKYIKAATPPQVQESVYDSLHSDGSVYNRSGTEAEEAYARFKSGLAKDFGMKPTNKGEYINTYKFRDGSYITVKPKAERELAFVTVYIRANHDIITTYEKLDESMTMAESSRYDYETHGSDVLIMDLRTKKDFYLRGEDGSKFTDELENWENHNGSDEFDNFMDDMEYSSLLESQNPINESFYDYLTAALWSSTTEDGTPLDSDHGTGDLSRDAEKDLSREYEKFLSKFGEELDALGDEAHRMAAHDLWLTQNGHGAGFWDRKESLYGKDLQDRMNKYAERAGEMFLYVGDDGKIHT